MWVKGKVKVKNESERKKVNSRQLSGFKFKDYCLTSYYFVYYVYTLTLAAEAHYCQIIRKKEKSKVNGVHITF